MTPVIVGVGVALVAVIVVWLVASVHRGPRMFARRSAKGARAAVRPTSTPDERAAGVIRDAERALAQARDEARGIVADAELKATEIASEAELARSAMLAGAREAAGRAAGEIRNDAKRTARAIIQEAERKAGEIVASAETAQAEAQGEVAREQELAAEARRDLATLLLSLLAEVQREDAGPANLYPLSNAQVVRGIGSDRAD